MQGSKQLAVAVVVALALSACATNGKPSKGVGGALIGSAAGAGLGAIIGHQSGHTGQGAAIGAGAGGLGGYVIGNEMDKSATNEQLQATQQQAAAAAEAANTVVINVTNSNGSITPVTLRRQGNIYVGPKGEQYSSIPTQDQLKSVYGF